MKAEMNLWIEGLFLGAALMLLILQYADADKYHERDARRMAVARLQEAHSRLLPYDEEKSRQISQRLRAIDKERESDPVIIQLLSPLTTILLGMAVGTGWLAHFNTRKKKEPNLPHLFQSIR